MTYTFDNLTAHIDPWGLVESADFDTVTMGNKLTVTRAELLEYAPRELWAEVNNHAMAIAAQRHLWRQETLRDTRHYLAAL